MMNIPVYIVTKIMVLLLTFGIVRMIRFGLFVGLRRLRWTKARIKTFFTRFLIGLLIWLMVLALLSLSGLLSEFRTVPPPVFWVLLPPILGCWVLLFLPMTRRLLRKIPKAWLLYAQSFRLVMDLIFWLGFLGYFVPKQMTFLWLNQDYTVGLTAFVAGYAFFSKGRNRYLEGMLWNIFGMCLLFNQVFLGYVSLPFPRQIINSGVSSIFLSDFPFVWIWGLMIPFGFMLHAASIYQILLDRRSPPTPRRRFSLDRKK